MGNLRNILRVTVLGASNKDGVAFDPAHDIPSLTNQVVLVTGGSGGIGTATVIALARYGKPAHIYIADLPPPETAAPPSLLDKLKQEIGPESPTELHFLPLNLGSFASVRECAAAFVGGETRLDLLVCNAGVLRGAHATTEEGYETHFGINYMGHALLTRLLVPMMVRTVSEQPSGAGLGRVVVVSSEGHVVAPKGGIAFDKLKTDCAGMSYLTRYAQSKLALVLLAKQLAHDQPQLRVMAIHPGRVATGIANDMTPKNRLAQRAMKLASRLAVSPEFGARNQLWAATSPDAVSGKYYEPVGVPDRESKEAKDEELRKKLWEWTENEIKDVQPLQVV